MAAPPSPSPSPPPPLSSTPPPAATAAVNEPALGRVSSSFRQPLSLLARAANYLLPPRAPAAPPAAAALGAAAPAAASCPGLPRTLAGVQLTGGGAPSPSPAPGAVGSWDPKSAMWRWIIGGSGATLLKSRRAPPGAPDGDDDDAAPLTISPPARPNGVGVAAVTVRASENPDVDLCLTAAAAAAASLDPNPAADGQLQQPAPGRRESALEMAHLRMDRLRSFCSAVATGPTRSPTRPDVHPGIASLVSGSTTPRDLVALLRDCARQSEAPWPLADLSTVAAGAFSHDVRGVGGPNAGAAAAAAAATLAAEATCQSARLLVALHALMIYDAGREEVRTSTGTAVEALMTRWTSLADVDEAGSANVTTLRPLILSYAKYLAAKGTLLAAQAPTFEGNYAIDRRVRRARIESVEETRGAEDGELRRQLLSAGTVSALLRLLGELRTVLNVWEGALAGPAAAAAAAAPANPPLGSALVSLASAAIGIPSQKTGAKVLDASSRELVHYVLGAEVFYLCGAIQGLVGAGEMEASLAAVSAEIFGAVQTVKTLAAATAQPKSLLAEALLQSDADDDSFRIDLRRMAACDDDMDSMVCTLHRTLRALPHDGSEEQDWAAGQASKRDRNLSLPRSCNLRGIECSFSSLTGLHAAIGAEIRARRAAAAARRPA